MARGRRLDSAAGQRGCRHVFVLGLMPRNGPLASNRPEPYSDVIYRTVSGIHPWILNPRDTPKPTGWLLSAVEITPRGAIGRTGLITNYQSRDGASKYLLHACSRSPDTVSQSFSYPRGWARIPDRVAQRPMCQRGCCCKLLYPRLGTWPRGYKGMGY